MAVTKRIVCLANSRKLGARCIAGRELARDNAGPWIRPVTERQHGEVATLECRCEDDTIPLVLDVIDVPTLKPVPDGYQQENWLIAPGQPWRKVGRLTYDQLGTFVDPLTPLWGDRHSTYHGINDKVPLALAGDLEGSLRLVRLDALTLSVFTTDGAFGPPRRRVQGRFSIGGTTYWLTVTDPIYEDRYKRRPDGDHQIGECFVTLSLSEPFEGACFKLIAAIIEPHGGGAR